MSAKPEIKNKEKYLTLAKKIGQEHIAVLNYSSQPKKRKDILIEGLKLANHTDNVRRYIEPLLELGLLERTIKDRPSSPLQRYFRTEKGSSLLIVLKEQS